MKRLWSSNGSRHGGIHSQRIRICICICVPETTNSPSNFVSAFMGVIRAPHTEEHPYRTNIISERVSNLYLYLGIIKSRISLICLCSSAITHLFCQFMQSHTCFASSCPSSSCSSLRMALLPAEVSFPDVLSNPWVSVA